MVKDFASKLAAIALTIAVSATCILGAVGPATASGQHAVASATRFMA